jgi:hypothetical protein
MRPRLRVRAPVLHLDGPVSRREEHIWPSPRYALEYMAIRWNPASHCLADC